MPQLHQLLQSLRACWVGGCSLGCSAVVQLVCLWQAQLRELRLHFRALDPVHEKLCQILTSTTTYLKNL